MENKRFHGPDADDACVRDPLGGETTHPLPFAVSIANFQKSARVDLFGRLAKSLLCGEQELESLAAELLLYVDATPATLKPAQLWAMRTGLLELVDTVLPAETRGRAREQLLLLLLQVAPLDTAEVD
jgi:hypothetical protein